jgi:hypothetical protein
MNPWNLNNSKKKLLIQDKLGNFWMWAGHFVWLIKRSSGKLFCVSITWGGLIGMGC